MRDFGAKKYNSFEEFNKDGRYLAEYVRNNTLGMTDSEKINYARFVFNETILNSCIKVGQISEDVQNILNCSNRELKFSMDNMIKNRLVHPEVTDEDYCKIPSIIKSPSKYYKSKSG